MMVVVILGTLLAYETKRVLVRLIAINENMNNDGSLYPALACFFEGLPGK